MAAETDMKTEERGSFLGWFLFLLVVIGVPVGVFIWMGGMRVVMRVFGSKKDKPDSRRDGYMRVDLEK